MTQILRILGILELLGMLGLTMGLAQAAQIQLNGNSPYQCVVVNGASTADGTAVIAYTCSGGPEDQWNYVNGQLQGIGTANGSSMCLDVYGQGTTAGTPVDLWPCNGQQNQQWQMTGGSIFSVQSGMCLDSSGGPSVGGGTQLIINPCSTSASQSWILRGVQVELPSTFPFRCANVKGSKTASGTPVILYSCGGQPNERWSLKSDGQLYGLGSDNGKTMCLTSSGLTAGSLVSLSTCTDSAEQVWSVVNGPQLGFAAGNHLLLVAAGPPNLCLEAGGGTSGTQLVVNSCTGAASQKWILR